jgi:hypothetical protein
LTLSQSHFLSMRQRFLPILLLAALLGCSKSDSNPIVDFGEGEGITYRNANNLPVGPGDPTDWTSDGEWNKQERALFPNSSFDLNSAQRPALVAYTTTYPNPAPGGQATWTLQTQRVAGTIPPVYTIQAVLVNRKYEIITRLGPVNSNTGIAYAFDYTSLGIGANELHRIYYLVSDASGLVYKGHGDIRYSPQ